MDLNKTVLLIYKVEASILLIIALLITLGFYKNNIDYNELTVIVIVIAVFVMDIVVNRAFGKPEQVDT